MNTFGLKLTPPRIVMTKKGERTVQSAPPTPAFWDAWRAGKAALKDAGWAVGKDQRTDEWQVTLWQTTMTAEARAEARSMSSAATAADVTIPVPAGLALLPYQSSGINYAMRREASLIADEMGLGKTIQAIGVANATKPDRILVICPLLVKLNWVREITKWQTLNLPVCTVKNGKDRFPVTSHGWVVINYDLVGKFETEIKCQQWDLIIIDEAHYLKNRGAQRTKLIFGGKQNANAEAGTEARAYEQIPATRRICLTGTPILNRPIELYTILNYLDPQRWPSWFNYAKRYCGAYNDGWGLKVDGATNLDELQARLRETIMVRRLKADVLTELPAKRYQVIAIEPDAACAKLIREENEIYARKETEMAEANAAALQAEVDGDELAYRAAVKRLKDAQQAAFTQTSLIRHEIGLAKVGNVIEHLKNCSEKTIVFAWHRDVIQRLVGGVNDDSAIWEVDSSKRGSKRQVGAATNDVPLSVRSDQKRKSQDTASRDEFGLSEVPSEKTWDVEGSSLFTGQHREVKGQAGGNRVHSGLARHKDSGDLSASRHSAEVQQQEVQSEQPVPGQNRSDEGIHDGQCVGNQLAGERDQAQRHSSGVNDDNQRSTGKAIIGCCAIVTGETPAADRQQAVDRFQNDPKIRFFVGNIQAAGVGITLTASSHVVFAEQDWTPGKMDQAADRAHRIGQRESVLIQHIVLEGSMDAHIAQTQVSKREVIERALDGELKVFDEAYVPQDTEQKTEAAIQDARRAKTDELAATLTPAQIQAIHEALKVVAAMDEDHARDENGVGFSKLDTMFGRSLAAKISLTPRQAAVGMRLARKYRRQYDESLYNQIFSQEERV